jgi:hypothetical protein
VPTLTIRSSPRPPTSSSGADEHFDIEGHREPLGALDKASQRITALRPHPERRPTASEQNATA